MPVALSKTLHYHPVHKKVSGPNAQTAKEEPCACKAGRTSVIVSGATMTMAGAQLEGGENGRCKAAAGVAAQG